MLFDGNVIGEARAELFDPRFVSDMPIRAIQRLVVNNVEVSLGEGDQAERDGIVLNTPDPPRG